MDRDTPKSSNKSLATLFETGRAVTFFKGDVIADSAQPHGNLYYIVSGYVKVYARANRNEQYLHLVYGPGEIFPLSWLLNDAQTNRICEALTECEIRVLPRQTLKRRLQSDGQLSYQMLLHTIEQYRIYTVRVDNLEYKYASERLAYRLLFLAQRFGTADGNGGVVLGPPLTHQLLGSSINLSRESVTREMEKLLRKGLVIYNSARQIVLTDPVLLAQQCKIPLDDIAGRLK